MKSTDVYALLRSEIGPGMKTLGFKRQKSFLSWSHRENGLNTVMWCQVSRDGWDDYSGSKFVIELQRSEGDEPGMPSTKRMRFAGLIDDETRNIVQSMQNEVIASLRKPPKNHAPLHVSPEVKRWYLQKFELEQRPYVPTDDLWFRYANADHVRRWGRLIVQLLPTLIHGIERVA